MTLTRWDPFGETVPVRQLMDRLMEDAVIQPGRLFGSAGTGAGAGMPSMSVALDLAEHENELTVTASLPGVRPEDVDISIQSGVLTIQGEVREEREQPAQTTPPQQGQQGAQANGQHTPEPSQQAGRPTQYHYRERRFGRFVRQVSLPVPVNAEQAEATFEHGVLTLRLPKAEQARRRRIEVRSQPAREGQESGTQKELTSGSTKGSKNA